MVDLYWLFILGICLAEIFLFMTIFFEKAVPDREMVSDIILSNPMYMILLTVFLGIRSVASLTFLARYRADCPTWVGAGAAALGLAYLGWIWLCTHGEIKMHVLGVAVFIFSTSFVLLVFVEIISLADEGFYKWRNRLMIGILCMTMLFASTYMAFWTSGDAEAYLPEHLAYAFYLLFQFIFFYYHTPNWNAPVKDAQGEFSDKQVLCIPLLRPPMADEI